MKQQVHLDHNDLIKAAIQAVRISHPEYNDKEMSAQMFLNGLTNKLVCKVHIHEDRQADNAGQEV